MNFRSSVAFTANLILVVLISSSVQGDEFASPLVIRNGRIRMELDRSQGGIHQIVDERRTWPLLEGDASPDLWSVTFMDGTTVLPTAAEAFSWQLAEDGRDIVLRWSKFTTPALAEFQVMVRIELDEREPTARGQIEFAGLQQAAVRSVAFPRIGPIAKLDGETLAVPQWMGEATTQARHLVNPENGQTGRLAWDYPGILSMQFLAWYAADGRGLLLSTDDTALLRKQLAVSGDGDGRVTLEAVHELPVDTAPDRVELPYRVQWRLFEGDWFTAAELYRGWANQQSWVRDSRLKSGQTPQWLRDAPLWVWNRGRSENVLKPAVRLTSETGLPVSVFWHWWHGCAYDVGFPEYFPPREGTESFTSAVADAQAGGVNAIVYMNQRLWGMTAPSWQTEGAAEFAVKNARGEIAPEVYNTFVKAPCASMCMGTPFWRDKYAALAERALGELGVSGIYMDQACSSLSCFDPSHGHPLGGGAYWMDGFKQLSEDIRRRADRRVTLAGEGCGEGWLPYLDAMLSLQVSLERYNARDAWTPLPLFNAVYHDSAIQFGNYSSLTRPPYDELWPAEFAPPQPLALLDRKFAAQFYLEQARSFVWGQQPTIANFTEEQLTSRREEIEFVLNLARLRASSLKYLRDGVMLRPPQTGAGEWTIPISRLSIYAGQLDAVKERTGRAPRVLTSAWQAPDGDVAVVLANITDRPVPLEVELNAPAYPIGEAGRIRRLESSKLNSLPSRSASEMKFDQGKAELATDLAPREVQIYEIVSMDE